MHKNFSLNQFITLAEVNYVVKAIKNNKFAWSDGIVGELIKCEGNPMCEMLLTEFTLVWNKEYISNCWWKGLMVSLLKELRKIVVFIEV